MGMTKAKDFVRKIEKTLMSLVTASTLWGCQMLGLGGMHVDSVATSTQKPSNVAVYVSVKDGDEAVYGLSEDNFTVSENDQILDSKQIGLRLLDRNVAAAHHAVVLVDLSGPSQEAGAMALLASQLAPFVERLRDKHSVSLYGFDGADGLVPLGSFPMIGNSPEPKPVTKEELSTITDFVQRDSSSNLNGAVIAGLTKINEELTGKELPIKLGTLIVIARGPDLAGRTKVDKLETALDDTKHQVFAVTIGNKDDTSLAETLGPAGYSQATVFENLENSLADVATQVERDYSRYYLLSYCSPARSGERTVLVEVSKFKGDGEKLTGKTDFTFNATGFASGCDAGTVPRFGKANVVAKTVPATTDEAGQAEQADVAEGPDDDGSEAPAETSAAQEQPIPPPPSDTYAQ